ncbi:MAG: cobalamin-binding protein [Burkholderiales bacterium]|nr:cobalamin-binding protein [Burkholderiales bacterium]
MTTPPSLRALFAAAIVFVSTSPSTTASTTTSATVSVVDDSGNTVTLTAPAQRIVSLAPHATELLFAAGAGNQVVGVSEYSDFPAAAKQLPSVGGSGQLDIERIASLKPDLIVAWRSGNNRRQLARLRKLGLTVFESEPRNFEAIADSLERLGALVGRDEGRLHAQQFRQQVQTLEQHYAGRSPVTVFYQIWSAPLMTLNDAHIVSQAIRLCGGVNVFGQLKPLVPTISREAVLTANPDVIIVSDEKGNGLERWRSFKRMQAVASGNLMTIDGGTMNRAGPRVIEATRTLCKQIDDARKRTTKNASEAFKKPNETSK